MRKQLYLYLYKFVGANLLDTVMISSLYMRYQVTDINHHFHAMPLLCRAFSTHPCLLPAKSFHRNCGVFRFALSEQLILTMHTCWFSGMDNYFLMFYNEEGGGKLKVYFNNKMNEYSTSFDSGWVYFCAGISNCGLEVSCYLQLCTFYSP